MSFWSVNSTSIGNDVVYVNNTYKKPDGNNALSTITSNNPTGFEFLDADSNDPIVKNLAVVIKNDGKIVYLESGSSRQYNSIQEFRNAKGIFAGYTDNTTKLIKDALLKKLRQSYTAYNDDNPDAKIGPAVAAPPAPRSPNTNVASAPFTLGEDFAKSSKSRNKYGNYYYPTKLKGTTQDRIKFTMKPVLGATVNPNLGKKTFTKRYGAAIGDVTLPIQPNINDSNTIDWTGMPLDALSAYGAGQALSLIDSISPEDFVTKGKNILTDVVKGLQDNSYKTAINIGLAQEAVGIQGLLSRATGAALNSNLELLFNGPQLRNFDFSFTMSPRDSKEATAVRNIIRFFKQGMSVKTTDSAVFLKSPHVFDIRYITYDGEGKQIDHPSINRIKTCALVGCDVNYTPDNTYMTFNEPGVNPMTSYQMTLRFGEIDPIYDEDYGYTDSEDKTSNPYKIGINDIGF